MFAPNEDQWRKDCKQAAELLRQDGWCQGTSRKPTGERCLMNAVRGATGYTQNTILNSGRYGDVRSRLIEKLGVPYPAIWNDDSMRTKEEVIDLLEDMAVSFA
jgi:hypothetical protein